MSKTIANKIEIEYELHSRNRNKIAETIVLIRGLGTQLIDWPDSLIEGLRGMGLNVLVFDNRDAGLTQHFENFGQVNLADIAHAEKNHLTS